MTYTEAPQHIPKSLPGFAELNLYSDEADWTAIKELLSGIHWKEIFKGKNCEEMLAIFTEKCQVICEANIPKKTELAKRKKIPRDRRILMKRRSVCKAALHRNISTHKEAKLQTALMEIGDKLLESHEEERMRDERRAVENIKGNSKSM